MGDTQPLSRRGHAVEGVSRNGRATALRRPAPRGRDDDGALRGIWDLAENRLQDLPTVSAHWRAGPHGSEPAAVSARESAPADRRADDRSREAGIPELGRPQDSRASATALA